jgi:glucose/arabinose dehydrogenase
MNRRVLALAIAAALVSVCRKNQPPPQTPQPSGEQITGRERIGWTQPATDATDLADFKYAIYIDGARSTLGNASCSPTPSPAGFDCSAPLPTMAPGAHVLELAAYTGDGGSLESSRSAPLNVIVSPATAAAIRPAGDPNPTELSFSTADGVRLHVAVLTEDLDEPTDLAAAPDGRLFVAERAGRIRVFHDGALHPSVVPPLADVTASGRNGLLALAIDPRFDSTHFVYSIYTTTGRGGAPTFAVARFREAHDTIADRAVLLDNVPASSSRPSASLRFGADGKLYVAFDDGGHPVDAGDLASFNGKVLRMNGDGTTPDDQAGATPVWSLEYRSPRGFDWQPASGSLWIVDGTANGAAELTAAAATGTSRRRAATLTTYLLPSLPGASAAAFYRGNAIPAFQGDLFIASEEGRHLLRVRFDPHNATRVAAAERLLQDAFGGLRAVAVDRGGALYVCTSHSLAKIAPAE